MKNRSDREESHGERLVKAQPGKERLLIIDDEVDMLEGLRRVLPYDLEGIEILTTAKPREALDWARKEPVDVVLLDIRMPEMDGLQLLGELLKVDRSLTVIMMTAYGSIETAVQAINSGAYDFITKPLDKDALLTFMPR